MISCASKCALVGDSNYNPVGILEVEFGYFGNCSWLPANHISNSISEGM